MSTESEEKTRTGVSPTEELLGTVPIEHIGPYRVETELGRGGMGSVYFAHRDDGELQMSVAIKLIRPEATSLDMIARFRRERQLLADLKHANITTLHDGGTLESGQPYLIMEFVQGTDIDDWVLAHKPSLPVLIDLFIKIVDAVAYAHSKGVIHRDIKPGNMMVDQSGEPKLLDFGIALLADQAQVDSAMTPLFAAPEQRAGGAVDERCDIYSLCVVLLQLLDGERPSLKIHPREKVTHLVEQGRPAAVISVESEAVPEALGHVLRCGLAEDPNDRYATATLLLADLKRLRRSLWHEDQATVQTETFRYDLLLWSHAADHDAVRELADRLQQAGLTVWPEPEDHDALPVSIAAITQALEKSRACAVCLGPLESPQGWHGPFEHAAAIRDHLAFRVACGGFHLLQLLLPGTGYPQRQSDLPAFLRDRAWTMLEGNPGDASRVQQALEAAQADVHDSVSKETGICPFRGLEVFREQDSNLFFGREALCQRIGAYLDDEAFVAVLGPSGSGKSSVVQAGVLPQLRQQGHQILLMTPTANPLMELAHVLQQVIDEPMQELHARLAASEEALYLITRDNFAAAADGTRLILVVDQFEEVFTLTEDKDVRERFIANLCYGLDQPFGCISLVLTMRSDFLGRCVAHNALNHYVLEHSIQVQPMSREALSRTIIEPVRLGGLTLEPGLMDRILDDVEAAEVELPLLEHALLELYHRRDRGRLTQTAYVQIGGIEGALAKRAETEFEALATREREVLRKMFTLCLIQPGEGAQDTRRRALREELLAVGPEETVERLLADWTAARLLTGSGDQERHQEMVDVAHEALIRKWPRIAEWMAEDRETARLLNRLRQRARAWEEARRDEDFLLRGASLLQMSELKDHGGERLGALELEYVEASTALKAREASAREAAARNLRRRKNQAVFASAIAMVLALVAFYMSYQARDARDVALESEQTALSEKARAETKTLEANYNLALAFNKSAGIALDEGDPYKAWLYTLAALSQEIPAGKTLPEPMGRFVDPRMRAINPLLWTSPVAPNLTTLAVNQDGSLLALADSDGLIRLMDTQTGRQLQTLSEGEHVIESLVFSADGHWLAAGSDQKDLYLWNLADDQFFRFKDGHQDKISSLSFSPDLKLLASGGAEGSVIVRELSGGNEPIHLTGEAGVTHLAFSERHLFAALADGSLRMMDHWPSNGWGRALTEVGAAEVVGLAALGGQILCARKDGQLEAYGSQGAAQGQRDLGAELIAFAGTLGDGNATGENWVAASVAPALLFGNGLGDATRSVVLQSKLTQLAWRGEVISGVDEQGYLQRLRASDAQPWDEAYGQHHPIWSVAISPDGSLLATGSIDGQVLVWDVAQDPATGNPTPIGVRHTFEGHTKAVKGLAFSPDGTKLATASSDNTIRLWDLVGKAEPQVLSGHSAPVLDVAFSADGRKLVTASSDKTAGLWDLSNGAELQLFEGHVAPVWGVAISPDGSKLASASADKTIKVWDLVAGGEPQTLSGHKAPNRGVAFSPDGSLLTSASYDRTVRIWDMNDGGEPRVLRGHTGRIWDVAFSPDGTRLASSSLDETIRVWDMAGTAEPEVLKGHSSSIYAVSFFPDGSRLATVSYDKTMRFWDLPAPSKKQILTGHDKGVYGVSFSPDGSKLASASVDKTIKIWDLSGRTEPQTLTGHASGVYGVTYAPGGDKLASAGYDKTVRIWDLVNGGEAKVFEGHKAPVNAVAFSPDGKLVGSSSYDRTVRVWDVTGEAEPIIFEGHGSAVLGVAFSPLDGRLASTSEDNTIRVWDVTGAHEPQILEGHTRSVCGVTFSADGTKLASSSYNHIVRLWEMPSGKPLHVMRGHTSRVYGVAFSPDGQWLASTSADQTVRIWNTEDGSEFAVLYGHEDEVNWYPAFSPDGQTLATTSDDKTIRLWQMERFFRPPADAAPREFYAEALERSLYQMGYRLDGIQIHHQPRMRLQGIDHTKQPSVYDHLDRPRPSETTYKTWLMQGY